MFVLAKDAPSGPTGDNTGAYNYVAQGSVLQNNKHNLRVGLEYTDKAKANQNVGAPQSSRGPQKDSFNPATIKLDEEGKKKFLLITKEHEQSLKVTLDGEESEMHQMLPAVFFDKFQLTVYYTTKETGYGGGNIRIRVRGRRDPIEVNNAFRAQVVMEGFGRLTPAHETAYGQPYLGYDPDLGYYLAPEPLGNRSNPLVPRQSCAVDSRQLRTTISRVEIFSPTLIEVLGNNMWDAADSGQRIGLNHIDLYWGDDEPAPDNSNWPAGYPANRRNYPNSYVQVHII